MELVNTIDNQHALVKLAKRIDWQACEVKLGGLYASGVDRPRHPIRLMVGLQLLKQICNVSEEELVSVSSATICPSIPAVASPMIA